MLGARGLWDCSLGKVWQPSLPPPDVSYISLLILRFSHLVIFLAFFYQPASGGVSQLLLRW